MQVTLTGTFTRWGALRRSDVDTYGYSYDGSAGQESDTLHCVAWFKPNAGDAFNEGYQDTLTSKKAELTIRVTKARGYKEDGLKLIYYQTEPMGGVNDTAEDLYRSLVEYEIYGTDFIGATEIVKTGITSNGTEKTITVTVTDTQKLEYLLAYGVAFDAAYGNNYKIGSMTLALSGDSNEAAPEISVDSSAMAGTLSDGTYYHPAGDSDFAVGVTYSQELGTAIQELRYTVKPVIGDVVTGTTTEISFTVPHACWSEIPASGVVEITAVSAHGIPSETLSLPYVITHYNVQVRSPVSGSILETGQDIELAWELVLPDGMPSAPAPTRYTIWPAWDDEKDYQVAYAVTERTYTIPASSFAGHTKLRLIILDEYGTDGAVVRRKGDGRLLMLYLQPSAAVSGITVTPEYTSGMYKPVLTVSWSSEGQSAFRVRADGVDYGPVWGTDTAYTIPKVFDDGVHEIRLQIQDAIGRWGSWSEPIFVNVVNNANTEWVSAVRAGRTERGVTLNITASGSDLAYADVLIYRNGVMIAQLPGTDTMQYEYEDTGANGVCEYYVRFLTANGFYAQTEITKIDATPETDGMILEDGTLVQLRYTPDHPRMYRISAKQDTYQRYYAGRNYPISVKSGQKSRIVNMEYIDKTAGICDMLEEAVGSVVIYKTVRGDVIRGELNQVNSSRGSLYSKVSFQLTEVDWQEEVPYTAGVVAYNV